MLSLSQCRYPKVRSQRISGPQMLCYRIAHEAHHRGQVSMLAHQLGHSLPAEISSNLWNWESPKTLQTSLSSSKVSQSLHNQ
jgi:uncharacterized damage-inducible protein DinB